MNAKVKKAIELDSKINGIMWAIEKNVEYKHYEKAKKCQQEIDKLDKELDQLKATMTDNEIKEWYASDRDYYLMERYHSLYR